MLARAGAAEAALSDFSGLKRGHLSVAASQTAGNYWLPAPLFAFRRQYPGITVDLRIGNTEQVAGWVEAGGWAGGDWAGTGLGPAARPRANAARLAPVRTSVRCQCRPA